MSKSKKNKIGTTDQETQTEVNELPPPPPILPLFHTTTQNFFILPLEAAVAPVELPVTSLEELLKLQLQQQLQQQQHKYQQLEYKDDEEECCDYEDTQEETDSDEDPRDKLKRCYSKDDNSYYDKLNKKKQKKIDKTEQEIKNIDFFKTPMRFRILESDMDMRIKSLAMQKIDELSKMNPGTGEYFKLKNWVEGLCRLPIGKYKSLPVSKSDPTDKITAFMDNTKTKFDELVYGHQHAKSQIIQLLAKLISNPTANGIVIGIYGSPGVGKTELSSGLSKILNLPFAFISLAGINGEHFFRGHSVTYEGSKHGRIADILMSAQYMNPVLYLDELDKVSTTRHGEEIANLLIHMTDFTQNHKFQDHYFGDIDLDMSKCIFVFSYNNEELVNPILRDRMIKIKANNYTIKDKIILAKDYMLPKIFKEFGFKKEELLFDDSIITYIVNKVDDESGARNMKRGLEEVIGSLNYKRILGELTEFPITITQKIVDEYLIISKKRLDSTSKLMMYT